MAATRTIGQMQEFNSVNETVTDYLKWFRLFISANDIEEAKLVQTLLMVVSSTKYSLIQGLVSPSLSKDKLFDELVEILKKHYDLDPIVIAECFHFYHWSQNARELIAEYLASFRRLANRCKFRDFLDIVLRDRLIYEIQSESTHAEGSVLESRPHTGEILGGSSRHGSHCRKIEGAEGKHSSASSSV